jgi:phosphatidylserine decarboxylase
MDRIPDVSPELPSRTWRLVLAALRRLPERGLSRSFGSIADIGIPPALRARVFTSFARSVGIDLSEVERPLTDYPTLNAFFVRQLLPGVRTWPAESATLASPVDAIVGQLGRVTGGVAVQAKGHEYSVADLLADATEATRFQNGSFLTLYLSPRHYHRIHTPAPGTIPKATYVPGSLYPVNNAAVMHIPGLFARNERLICYLDSERGRVAVVAVGAYNVGRISAAFDPQWSGALKWVTNRRPPAPLKRTYNPPREVRIGHEIMAFHLGSTVVLLLEEQVPLRSDLKPGMEVEVGEPISGD